jgi:hypothetical protein
MAAEQTAGTGEEQQTQETVEQGVEPDGQATETTETSADTKPDWDKERQKIDQERANLQKERERIEREKAELEAAKAKTVTTETQVETPAPQQAEDDDLEKIEKLVEEAEALADTDPYESAKKTATAQRLTLQRQKRIEAERTAAEQHRSAEQRYWDDFVKKNPDVPVNDAKKLADKLIAEMQTYVRPDKLQEMVTKRFNEEVAKLKKPAPQSQTTAKPAAPKTAPAARTSAPAKTAVVNNGAREQPLQQRQAMKDWLGPILGKK